MTARPTDADFSDALTAINLHRIWWTIIVAGALNVAILAGNLLGFVVHSPRLAAWQGIDVLTSVVLLALIRLLERRPGASAWRRGAVVAYLLIVLALMDNYYFVLLHVYGHTASYVLGVITAGVLLLLPPRQFIGILLANHAIFCALLLVSGQPSSIVAAGMLDGSCGVLVAGLAGWFLYRAKGNDFDQQHVIAARNRELRLRNEEMGDVMAITAHDLRSPLQGVKHLLDFAAPMGGPERLTTSLNLASQSCGEMIVQIDRLLQTHATGGDFQLLGSDLRSHFESAARRAQPLAGAKDIHLELRLPAKPAEACFETGALAQVLDNLLGNAIKFSPPGGAVTLKLAVVDGCCSAEVGDEGPGIAEEERELVFHKFHRVEERDEPGNGLGLFIVRKLMEAMHGSVSCEPREGKGTIFRLRFAAAEGVL